MLDRVATWHGEQASKFYQIWCRTGDPSDERDYCRHAAIASRMWWKLQDEQRWGKK